MAYLRLCDASVDFPVYFGASRSLKKELLSAKYFRQRNIVRGRDDRATVKALDRINLQIEQGERIGLLGENGAGKTTLLGVLGGIYEPTEGTFESSGSVSSLLGVNVGLDTDATGIENIILRGMYMGIPPSSMRTRVDDIAGFTELGPYLEMPVKTYSAGMMVRLSFAIATCVEPEILLIDEWLGAVDEAFLKKAEKRMQDFIEKSSIVVIASHSTALLKKWCNRGVLLRQGQIVRSGEIGAVADDYLKGESLSA